MLRFSGGAAGAILSGGGVGGVRLYRNKTLDQALLVKRTHVVPPPPPQPHAGPTPVSDPKVIRRKSREYKKKKKSKKNTPTSRFPVYMVFFVVSLVVLCTIVDPDARFSMYATSSTSLEEK